MIEIGVTDTRLLTIGIPSSAAISSPTVTKSLALDTILLYTFSAALSISESIQSRSEIPMVMVRTSKFCSSIMAMVSVTCLISILSYSYLTSCA